MSLTLNLETTEIEFLSNLLITNRQDRSQPDVTIQLIDNLWLKVMFSLPPVLTEKEVGYLQFILQELTEIDGRISSTANEKINPRSFQPRTQMLLTKSISDKLGAHLIVNTTIPQFPPSPREEGSMAIMQDPSLE